MRKREIHSPWLVTLACVTCFAATPRDTHAAWSNDETHATEVMPGYLYGVVPDGRGSLWVLAGTNLQRLQPDGTLSFPAPGLTFGTSGQIASPALASDGAGGVFVAWTDKSPGAPGIYAQHFDTSGTAVWAVSGARVTADSSAWYVAIASDGTGALHAAWVLTPGFQVETRRLLADGTPASPVVVLSASGNVASIVADHQGGHYVAWGNRLQHVTAYGTVDPAWPADGLATNVLAMLADGAGGVYVWDRRQERRSSGSNPTPCRHRDGRRVVSRSGRRMGPISARHSTVREGSG